MDTDDGLIAVIRQRRTVRRYVGAPLARPVVTALLAAATAAPSAHNRQPWRFVVVDDPAARDRLARAMGDRLRADRLADGDDPAVIAADVARSYARIVGAPTVIVVLLTMAEMDTYPDARRREFEYLMAVQGTAAAVQNLLLAAHALGLGASWMCAPLFCSAAVVAALDAPRDWIAQALVTVGAPGPPSAVRGRKPIDDIAIWR